MLMQFLRSTRVTRKRERTKEENFHVGCNKKSSCLHFIPWLRDLRSCSDQDIIEPKYILLTGSRLKFSFLLRGFCIRAKLLVNIFCTPTHLFLQDSQNVCVCERERGKLALADFTNMCPHFFYTITFSFAKDFYTNNLKHNTSFWLPNPVFYIKLEISFGVKALRQKCW